MQLTLMKSRDYCQNLLHFVLICLLAKWVLPCKMYESRYERGKVELSVAPLHSSN